MPSLQQQAERLESLLPKLGRALSIPQELDPLSELTPAQLRFVRAIRGEPRPLSEVAHELQMSLSAATQLAQRLEDQGLLQRLPDPEDKRVRRIGLSPEGEAKLEARRCLRLKSASIILQGLSQLHREQVIVALERLVQSDLGQSEKPRRNARRVGAFQVLEG